MKKIILAFAMLLTVGAQAQTQKYTYTVKGETYDVCQVSNTQISVFILTDLPYHLGGQKYFVYKDNKGTYCILLKDNEGRTYRYDLPETEQKMYAHADKHQDDWDK